MVVLVAVLAGGFVLAGVVAALLPMRAPGMLRGTTVDCGSLLRPGTIEDEPPSVLMVCGERRREREPEVFGSVGFGLGVTVGAGVVGAAGRRTRGRP